MKAHTRNLMAGHFVLKSVTGEQVETDPGCNSTRSSSSLTCVGLRYPDLLEAFHALDRIVPGALSIKQVT